MPSDLKSFFFFFLANRGSPGPFIPLQFLRGHRLSSRRTSGFPFMHLPDSPPATRFRKILGPLISRNNRESLGTYSPALFSWAVEAKACWKADSTEAGSSRRLRLPRPAAAAAAAVCAPRARTDSGLPLMCQGGRGARKGTG